MSICSRIPLIVAWSAGLAKAVKRRVSSVSGVSFALGTAAVSTFRAVVAEDVFQRVHRGQRGFLRRRSGVQLVDQGLDPCVVFGVAQATNWPASVPSENVAFGNAVRKTGSGRSTSSWRDVWPSSLYTATVAPPPASPSTSIFVQDRP